MAKRHRSPAYPALTLTEALDKAKVLLSKEGRHSAPVKVAASHWGYSPKSSGGAATVAALKAWGLANDEGTGESRTVRLSQRAMNILQDTRDDSSERNMLLAEAARTPKIMGELLDEYKDGSISDGNLNFYLVQKEYNPNAVKDIIKAYRDAVSYVWVLDVTADDREDEDSFVEPQSLSETGGHDVLDNENVKSKQSGGIMKRDTFSLEEGDVTLVWPSSLSSESYADLKDWLMIIERKIGRSVQLADQEEGHD